MDDQDVKIWQQALKDRGLYLGTIDGDFGPGTRRASFEAVAAVGDLPEQFATLVMVNQKATRNRPITDHLRDNLIRAATIVYGPKCKLAVYSGGQPRTGPNRTGSIRHNDFGDGGCAADLYVYLDGRKIQGTELAKLGQYWLASKLGGCGLEMATGGIHLDQWTTPPPGGGMFWTYPYLNGKAWGDEVHAMMVRGANGIFPHG